ncbi:MAG: Crp/Fnr family transcriptional regulator [Brotaphodocola sp.]
MRQTTYYFDKMFQEFLPQFEKYATASRKVNAGHYLVAPGEGLPNVFYIKSGICRCSAITDDGEEVILSFHGPGSLYPVKCRQFHFALETSVTFRAVTPVSVLVLPPSALLEMTKTCPEFAVAAIDFHTIQSNMFIARQMVSIQNDVIAKVATFLYIYQYSYPTVNNCIHLTQDDVALSLGISRIQVARVYQTLRKEGIITTFRNGVQILNFDKLKKCCSELIVV